MLGGTAGVKGAGAVALAAAVAIEPAAGVCALAGLAGSRAALQLWQAEAPGAFS
jgi:hypothetical protein